MIAVLAIALFLGLAALSSKLLAQDVTAGACRKGSARVFPGLDQIYVRDEFRIIYALEGRHALANVQDFNHNGIPDQVEDVATQLVVGRRLFSDVIGLTHILEQPRYQFASSIDVFLLDLKRGNGLSYDEVMNYRFDFDGAEGHCALRMDIKNTLSNQNVTPAHELFHQYQYGYTMFKARWFLEGTARWAEYTLRPGYGAQATLPQTTKDLQKQVFSQTYAAGKIWNRLGTILDPAGRLPLPPDLKRQVYVDGSPVIHGDMPRGASFIKGAFEALAKASDEASARNAWDRYNWAEQDQRSSAHDQEMLRAILGVADRKASEGDISSSELDGFLKLDPH